MLWPSVTDSIQTYPESMLRWNDLLMTLGGFTLPNPFLDARNDAREFSRNFNMKKRLSWSEVKSE